MHVYRSADAQFTLIRASVDSRGTPAMGWSECSPSKSSDKCRSTLRWLTPSCRSTARSHRSVTAIAARNTSSLKTQFCLSPDRVSLIKMAMNDPYYLVREEIQDSVRCPSAPTPVLHAVGAVSALLLSHA